MHVQQSKHFHLVLNLNPGTCKTKYALNIMSTYHLSSHGMYNVLFNLSNYSEITCIIYFVGKGVVFTPISFFQIFSIRQSSHKRCSPHVLPHTSSTQVLLFRLSPMRMETMHISNCSKWTFVASIMSLAKNTNTLF